VEYENTIKCLIHWIENLEERIKKLEGDEK